ncbi:MAG TPA: NAD-dependent epimerase/dehydratase family protein [Anaerolineae bacterium]|nr:NAD-dependent epimerase/dehydratase family protein [Anaerolineae bacterium]
MNETTILITGVAGGWGRRLAARLTGEPGLHIIGLDAAAPDPAIPGLDFIQADVRNPLLADLLRDEGVDAVCHLAFVETTRPQAAAFDLNVMGTTKLLEACVEAGVRKVVLKSSTAVYGARPSNPAFLRESRTLRGSRQNGTIRDLIEIENFCAGFRRRHPDLLLTILRFPGIVGPTADTPLSRFLRDPTAPTLLGFDPMMQLIHEDDVVEALAHAVRRDAPGVFNVAAEDAMPLSKMRGLAGKPLLPLPHLLAYWGPRLPGGKQRAARHWPIEPDYLRYPWVADLSRMRDELGFAPRYTAEETLREFAERRRLPRYGGGPATLARDEERLRQTLARRRQARAATAPTEGNSHDN